MRPMGNRLPTGPGSRGGHIHEPEYRRAYWQAWKKAHPEYRERERLRRWKQRHPDGSPPPNPVFPKPLPLPAAFCVCSCGCREHVVRVCGMCRDGMHHEA